MSWLLPPKAMCLGLRSEWALGEAFAALPYWFEPLTKDIQLCFQLVNRQRLHDDLEQLAGSCWGMYIKGMPLTGVVGWATILSLHTVSCVKDIIVSEQLSTLFQLLGRVLDTTTLEVCFVSL